MIILLESIYSLNSCQGRAAFLLCSDLRCTKLHFGQIVSIDNLITLLLFCLITYDENVYQFIQRTHEHYLEYIFLLANLNLKRLEKT